MDDKIVNGKIEDISRIEYLKSYIIEMGTVINDGVNVKGYFVWSLLDNFEWHKDIQRDLDFILLVTIH